MLALPAALVASRVDVPFWTDDYGYCKPLPGLDAGVHRPDGLDRIIVETGTSVFFTYSTHHDVWQVPTLDELESCDMSGATQLAGRTDGGGCEDETDAACMAAATAYELRTPTAGEMYLACGVGDHCANGQRITISVVDELADETPRVIDVPYWTDDYGYCKPLPGHDAGVHRPNGLVPIGAQVGQILNFKYSMHHDVWRLPTREAFDACDFSEATMLADTDAGGGCALDEDLECILASKGFGLELSEAGPLYLACSIHDHCLNGQRLVVNVVSGAMPAAWKAAADNAAMFADAFVGALLGASLSIGLLFCLYRHCSTGGGPQHGRRALTVPREVPAAPAGRSDDPAHAAPGVVLSGGRV